MSQDNIIGWTEWEEKYKPIPNPLADGYNNNLWDCMFETFGDDLDALKALASEDYYIWTMVDNNPNSIYLDIMPGMHWINRMGYFVTEKGWTDKDLVVSNDPSYKE